MLAAARPRPGDRRRLVPAAQDRATPEPVISRLFQAARDNARDILAAAAASAYFLGFFGAIHVALDKLAY